MPEKIQNDLPEDSTLYVCPITPEQVHKLEVILRDRGWEFSDLPYAFWKAVFAKMTVVAYKSGKLVVQGKGAGELALFTIEPEVTGKAILGYEDQKKEDRQSKDKVFFPHAGVDESGKGDVFGPLTIASVFLDERGADYLKKIGVKDSKSIKSEAKIVFLAREIKKTCHGIFSVVSIGAEAYNRLYGKFKNLNRLLAWGHARAIENILDKKPDLNYVLSDKFAHETLLKKALLEKGREIKLIQQTKAESDVVVAAASILARSSFVEKMKELSSMAGFCLPKGAGEEAKTAVQRLIAQKGRESLSKFSKLHFKTVQEILQNEDLYIQEDLLGEDKG